MYAYLLGEFQRGEVYVACGYSLGEHVVSHSGVCCPESQRCRVLAMQVLSLCSDPVPAAQGHPIAWWYKAQPLAYL